jgi:hypothetical protein
MRVEDRFCNNWLPGLPLSREPVVQSVRRTLMGIAIADKPFLMNYLLLPAVGQQCYVCREFWCHRF